MRMREIAHILDHELYLSSAKPAECQIRFFSPFMTGVFGRLFSAFLRKCVSVFHTTSLPLSCIPDMPPTAVGAAVGNDSTLFAFG